VNFESPASPLRVASPAWRRLATPTNFILAVGCAVLILPTMFQVARDTWSTEQGGHGPLVLATGLWAVWRELKAKHPEMHTGKAIPSLLMLGASLTLFVLARITGILEIEGFAMYGAVIAGAYFIVGGAVLRAIWLPLFYLAFTLPPPDTVVAAVTQPIKIAISSWAVSVLHAFGLPIASSGVTIQVGQYQLLVAAACAGLNSIVTLTALCLFYVYLRHRSNPIAFLVIAVAAALTGCNEDRSQQTKTVGWFLDHRDELAMALKACRDNPGELGKTANCINANEARNKVTIQEMKDALK